jgi:hypothetical protein
MLGVRVVDNNNNNNEEEEGGSGGRKKHPNSKHSKHGGSSGRQVDSSEKVSREDWMTKPMKREARVGDNAGGQGSSSPEGRKQAPVAVEESRHVDPTNVVKKDFTVGDGGASWRMKALKRAQVQASVEGASLSEVVGQRWGSVAELAGGAGHAAAPDAHTRSTRDRKDMMRDAGGRRRDHHRHHRHGGGQGRTMMKRPREGVSWRREGSSKDKGSGDGEDYEDVVQRAAKDMNAFQNDGGFLDSFARGAEEQEMPADASSPERRVEERARVASLPETSQGQSNTSVAAMLRARLAGKAPKKEQKDHTKDSHVVLPMVDAQGRAAPGAFGRETAAEIDGGLKPQKRFDRYQDGQKTRYFATDDAVDLDTMVKRTKHGMEDNMDDVIARNIAKKSHYKGNEFDPDDEYDFDAGVEFLETGKASKQSRRHGDAREEAARKEKQRQVRDYQRLSHALDKCRLCFASPSRRKHLTVSVATSAYLALPEKGRLVPGHCCVVPIEHIPSARLADETTWEEMRNFKKCVLQMFADKGMDCIFFETVRNVDSSMAHAMVECVPVSRQVAAKAPIYFKKGIDDATEEWSQHAAKRCIETESRHLQKKIPPNFPYFHVEFGLAAGFVHVIDNPKEFDPLFARRILVGLLGLPEKDMHSKMSREGEEIQKQWVEEFSKAYSAYDWVQQAS